MYEIQNPRKINKGAFFGTFSVKEPDGRITRDLKLFQKGANSWVSFPAREYEVNGEKRYFEYISYDTTEKVKSVKADILAAVELYLVTNPDFEEQKVQIDQAPF